MPESALEALLGEPVASAQPVAGGSINDAWRVELGSGRRAFVKGRAAADEWEYRAEAGALEWLAAAGVSVPAVLAVGGDPPGLALEWIEPGRLTATGAEELGRAVAALHRAGAPRHGSLPPGAPDGLLRIGSVALEFPAPADGEDWPQRYAERMLLPLVARARDRGSLAPDDAAAVKGVCERIADLAGPPEPPARLHGDLWGGNVHAAADGSAWLIDPAAYGGHREVDLAMLRLFGGPGEPFFAAYDEVFPLADGHAERTELWQLLPLLVHAVLFGGSYGAAAGRAARRYA
jgi:fructosamine-3-kinase